MPTNPQGPIRLRRLGGATATTSLAALYTVEDQQIAEVTHVTACNTDSSVRTVTVKFAGVAVMSGLRLGPAGGAESVADWSGCHYLHSGEAIQVQADANSVVEVYASGGVRKDQ